MAAEQKERQIEEFKRQREEEELKTTTFKPRINKSNPNSLHGSRSNSIEPIEENVITHGKQTKDRKNARLAAYDRFESKR